MTQPIRSQRMSWTRSAEIRNDLQTEGVKIIDEDCVLEYLERHQDMADGLTELCRLVRAEFGAAATIELSWREELGSEDFLQLVVRLPSYGEGVADRLRSIDAAYEKHGHFERSGWILLTTDYATPR